MKKPMEQRLDRALLSVQRLTAALDEYVKVQEDILTLEAYYGSNEWKQEFAHYALRVRH